MVRSTLGTAPPAPYCGKPSECREPSKTAPPEARFCERKRRSVNEPKVYGPESLPPELSFYDLDYSLKPLEAFLLFLFLNERSAEIGRM